MQIRIAKLGPDSRAELNMDPDAQHCKKGFEGSSTTAANVCRNVNVPIARPITQKKEKAAGPSSSQCWGSGIGMI